MADDQKHFERMMSTKKESEIFDAAQYAAKMDLMIKELRTKTPGAPAGQIRKNEVLALRRTELQQLLKDGYTVHQIADAIKTNVFSVLPKTITEIVANKQKKSSGTTAVRKTATRGTAATTTAQTAAMTKQATDATTAESELIETKKVTINKSNSTNNFVDID